MKTMMGAARVVRRKLMKGASPSKAEVGLGAMKLIS